jgi:hypothetical protein
LNRFLLAAALVVLLVLGTRLVDAQIPTIKGKGKLKEVVELIQTQLANLNEVGVFTVPVGRRLVITDVLIANSNGTAANFQRILRNNTDTIGFVSVQAGDTFEHTFGTGIEFAAGDIVVVRNGGSAGPIDFLLRGYTTKP